MTDHLELDEILEAIESYDNIEYKAIVSLIFTSSMKASKICQLTIGDFVKASNYENISDILESNELFIPCWTDDNTITFNSPKTTDYILQYLKKSNNCQLNDTMPLFYSNRSNDGFYTQKSIEKIMSEKNTNPKFKQKNIRNYFKLICTTQLIVENENDLKFITDLLMGEGSPDNPFFNKRDELKEHYTNQFLPLLGENNDSNENDTAIPVDVRDVVGRYYKEYEMQKHDEFEFKDHFELRNNAYLLAEKDAEEGKFENNIQYLTRLFKKAEIEYIVYGSIYYGYAYAGFNDGIIGDWPGKSIPVGTYEIIEELGIKEILEISEERLKMEIDAAIIVKNLGVGKLTYGNLMTIFDCILFNIVDEIYLSEGFD